jgi:hypothetical protein
LVRPWRFEQLQGTGPAATGLIDGESGLLWVGWIEGGDSGFLTIFTNLQARESEGCPCRPSSVLVPIERHDLHSENVGAVRMQILAWISTVPATATCSARELFTVAVKELTTVMARASLQRRFDEHTARRPQARLD